MFFYIGIGNFNKFYWYIILSALFKLMIDLSFNIEYQNKMRIESFSIINQPALKNHIFIWFIYNYLGIFILGVIFQKVKLTKQKTEINTNAINNIKDIKGNNSNESESNGNKHFTRTRSSLIHHNYILEVSHKSYGFLVLAVILFILNEMIIFYFNQKNYDCVNFWVLEIFFIHFLFSKKNKLKLYKHQLLSFSIIILFSFGIKFICSFIKQCEYPIRDINDIDKDFEKMMENATELSKKIMNTTFFNNTLKKKINETNNNGLRACRNMYNVLMLSYNFEYLIILSAIGYILALFLHSYSAVKFKSFIDKKYISPYLIIVFIGLIGASSNIILLIISSFIPCGRNNFYIHNFCHAIVYQKEDNLQSLLYFDNFLDYISRLRDSFYPHEGLHKYNDKVRNSKDGIIEIIFSLFILPTLSFFKTIYDLFIIKELGVFHLLFPEVIYRFFKDLIIIIYKIINNLSDKAQLIQFIFIILSNLFAIIGFAIYLELIEIRFCGFDKNLKKNIIFRSIIDKEYAEEDNDDLNLSQEEIEIKNNIYKNDEDDED